MRISTTLLCENIGDVSFSFQWRMKMNSKISHVVMKQNCCALAGSCQCVMREVSLQLLLFGNCLLSKPTKLYILYKLAAYLCGWLYYKFHSFWAFLSSLAECYSVAWILKDHNQEPKKQRYSFVFQSWSSEMGGRQVFDMASKIKQNDAFKISCSYVLQINTFFFFFFWNALHLSWGHRVGKRSRAFALCWV